MDVFEEQYGEMDLLFSTNQTRVIQKVVEENVAVTGVDLSFSSFTPVPSGNIVTLELEMPPATLLLHSDGYSPEPPSVEAGLDLSGQAEASDWVNGAFISI